MPTINDPNGTAVKVTDSGRLKTYTVIETEALHVNEDDGKAFVVLVDVTSATPDDDFFYLKNNDDDLLIIERIEGWCDDASQEIKVLIGATDAGTDAGDALTPANMKVASGNSANVDCTQDATDLAITGGTPVALLKFPPVALTRAEFKFAEGIILSKNQRLHMEAALAGLINLNIYFYFHS